MKLRIDFGRILPGLLLMILGIVLLVVFALGAVVVFLFSFLPGFEVALRTVSELTIVPGVMILGGLVVILTGVAWWGGGSIGWFTKIAEVRALKDRIRLSERVGEIFGVLVASVVFLFLYANQLRGVAFFTGTFGWEAQFFFYAPLFAGIALSLTRAFYGHRNGIRPFDSMNALFLAIASFWLLSVFPFDFTHFGDMFPASIQFVFGWLNNDLGRLLFVLGGVGSMINFVYTTFLYSFVRSQLIAMHGGNS